VRERERNPLVLSQIINIPKITLYKKYKGLIILNIIRRMTHFMNTVSNKN